jgi:hypothetical protein
LIIWDSLVTDTESVGLFASYVEVIKSSLRDVGEEIGRSKASTAVVAEMFYN